MAGENASPEDVKFKTEKHLVTKRTARQKFSFGMYIAIWLVLCLMIVSNLFTLVLPDVIIEENSQNGEYPSAGIQKVDGVNDDPNFDRVIVCVPAGRIFRAEMLSVAVKDANVVARGDYKGGFRTIARTELKENKEIMDQYWTPRCNDIAYTIEGILDSCKKEGFLPEEDHLRMFGSINAETYYDMNNTLPVVMVPFWDNWRNGRYVVPGKDGVPCSMVLNGRYYLSKASPFKNALISKSASMTKTKEWLGEGSWSNGWYETSQGKRYYSFIAGDRPINEGGLGVKESYYLTETKEKLDCENTETPCRGVSTTTWQNLVSQNSKGVWTENIAIMDGEQNGYALFKVKSERWVVAIASLDQLIAFLSMGMMLAKWYFCIVALFRGYKENDCEWQSANIGVLACTKSFNLLPIALLPRIGTIFVTFWCCGLNATGHFRIITDAWNLMYTGIAEFVLFYYAIFNVLGKLTQRRINDRTFGPDLLFLSLLHFFRRGLTVDEVSTTFNITPKMLSSWGTMDRIFVHAYKLSGSDDFYFALKVIILLIPVVEFALSKRMGKNGTSTKFSPETSSKFERTVARYSQNYGGLGKNIVLKTKNLPGYEVVRLGYLGVGKKHIMSFDNWYSLSNGKFFSKIASYWNFTVQLLIRDGNELQKDHVINVTYDDQELDNLNLMDIRGVDLE